MVRNVLVVVGEANCREVGVMAVEVMVAVVVLYYFSIKSVGMP